MILQVKILCADLSELETAELTNKEISSYYLSPGSIDLEVVEMAMETGFPGNPNHRLTKISTITGVELVIDMKHSTFLEHWLTHKNAKKNVFN